jgi:hypothetical protein
MSAVNEARLWVNPVTSPGATSRSTNFQNFEEGDNDSVQTWRKKNSLYDYGMGSQSVRSFRTDTSVII